MHERSISIAYILKESDVCKLKYSGMTSPADLTELRRTLREILPDPDKGVFAVLTALKNTLPEQTEKYNAVFN
jgi:hypothetical protein